MASRIALLLCLSLAGCSTSFSAASVSPMVRAPDHNCDGTELTDLARYEIYYGRQSRVHSGYSVAGYCDGPGPADYDYGYMKAVGLAARGACTVMLDEPGNWYFAVVAVTGAGEKSSFSGEFRDSVSTAGPYTIEGCADVD